MQRYKKNPAFKFHMGVIQIVTVALCVKNV